jgi:hypothetical protein
VIQVHSLHDDSARSKPQLAGSWKVLWTRGPGCADLAALLSAGEPIHAKGDLRTACIVAGADLLVASSLTSFDLVSTVVPHHVDLGRAHAVVAAVAGGPHSALAARIAGRVAAELDIPGEVVSVSPDEDGDRRAAEMLESVGAEAPDLGRRVLRAGSARAVLDELDPDTLLVLGAPGGSWLQRQFFGPGKRLIGAAPDGVLVVRQAPTRIFQLMGPAEAVGPELRVEDARRTLAVPSIPVVADGRMIGILRVGGLGDLPGDATAADAMEDPVSVYVDDLTDDLDDLRRFLDGGPVPVVHDDGRLIGWIPA